MSGITLGYWDCRGRGESIRLLLTYAGVEFNDKRYKIGASLAETMDASEWKQDKFNLGLEFPNLPYLIDGQVKLTQSVAILRYLGRKYNLTANNDTELIRIDLVEQESCDLRQKLRSVIYSLPNDSKRLKDECFNSLPPKLEQLSNFLGDRKFVVGDRLTYVDFLLYDVIDFFRVIDDSVLNGHQVLIDYMLRFEAIPAINDYMSSSRFTRVPLGAPWASFGVK